MVDFVDVSSFDMAKTAFELGHIDGAFVIDGAMQYL